MDATQVAHLKQFVEQCEANPAILRDPQLHFFRSFLERIGAKVPGASGPAASAFEESDDDMPELEERTGAKSVHEESEDEIIESEVELDNEGVVTSDNDPPQKMGDASIEVTDEMRDKAQDFKGQAMQAIAEGDLDEAVRYLAEAICCNPSSALLYANRAGVYVKMKKPNAAIRDAEAAIKLNPDSAKGYKWRGEAKALLGQWEDAAKDLHLASKLDFDEEIAAILKKVEPNAHKLDEHRRKYERLRKQRAARKAEKERQRRRAEAQAAYEKVHKSSSGPAGGGMPGRFGEMPGMGGMPGGGMPDMGGGMPGMGMGGGMPGMGMGGGMPGMGMGGMPGGVDMSKILNDPELMAAFQDPEIMSALQDVMKNPASLSKHESNPKISPIINKMKTKFGSS